MTRSPVAVVTGSNRGIGPAIVRTLQRAGYTVVSNGRSALPGPGDVHVRADVTTRPGAKKLIAAARRLGRLDLLVCGVGDFSSTPVSDLDLEAWEELFESNLKSAWLAAKEALPLLRKSKGVLITLGGPVSQTVRANPRYVAYAMAKTALAVFTKSLASAEARRGVRVNMVNPGFIQTSATSSRKNAGLALRVPARRLGAPEDVAQAVAWLASPAAGYVTGAVLDVGGGLWT